MDAIGELNNRLFFRVTIETVQYENDIKLSEHKYVEEVEYPTLTNNQANTMTLDVREMIQNSLGSYVRQLGEEKAKRVVKDDNTYKPSGTPSGVIR